MQITQSYNTAANRWRTRIEGLGYAAAYRWLIRQSGLQSHRKTVLDAGCGTGEFARALIEVSGRPAQLTLLDPARDMIANARLSLRHLATSLHTEICGLEDAPQIEHDIVLCAHVIEHFSDPRGALRLLRQQLARDGAMLLVVSKPHWCNWIIWLRWRHRMIRPAVLLGWLADAGLHCNWHAGFPAGPPHRSSHAYLLIRTTGDIT